ncbi:hypothetical protein AB4K20DRAFT_1916110 [Rhizopus microsporus]
MAHSRICNIIYQYKMAFEQSKDQPEEYLSSLNACMLNMCSASVRMLVYSSVCTYTHSPY